MDYVIKSRRGVRKRVSPEQFSKIVVKMAAELDNDQRIALRISKAMLEDQDAVDAVVREEIARAAAQDDDDDAASEPDGDDDDAPMQKFEDPSGQLSSGTGLPRPAGRLDNKRLSARKRGPGRLDTWLNNETN
jgi:hypothetical protein